MFSRGPRPTRLNDSVSSQVSLHPHEVTRVLNTIDEILATSAEIIQRDKVYLVFLMQLNTYRLLTVVPTLERKLMYTCRHLGQSIRSLRISIGRGYVAPSIHRPTTSQALINI